MDRQYQSVDTVTNQSKLYCVVTARFVLTTPSGTYIALSYTNNLRFGNTPLLDRTAWLGFLLQRKPDRKKERPCWKNLYYTFPPNIKIPSLIEFWSHVEHPASTASHKFVTWHRKINWALPPFCLTDLESEIMNLIEQFCRKDNENTPEALIKVFNSIPSTAASLIPIKYLEDIEKLDTILEL